LSEDKNNQIMHAQIDWSDQSELFSLLFNSEYFKSEQGLQQSRDLFCKRNQLIETWLNWQDESFCIAETAFSTGLNFLFTCYLFEDFLQNNPAKPLKRLFFSCFEQEPLSKQVLKTTLQKWPMLNTLVAPLLTQYPLTLVGCHRLHFEAITLDLWFGDIQDSLSSVYLYREGLFDYWYLDYSAVGNKTDVFNEAFYLQILRSSKLGASIATNNCSNSVKYALQACGFNMSQQNIDDKNIEILVGQLQQKTDHIQYGPQRQPIKTTNSKDIAVIGGGISSACLSLALVNRGYNVTLYCKDKSLALGASGNQQGALYPLLNAQHNTLSQLFANSFLYARNYVEQVNSSHPFDYDLSGLLQLYYDNSAAKKLDKIMLAQLPEDLVQKVTQTNTDILSNIDIGLDALFYPLAGWLSPTQMVKSIFQKAQQTGLLTVKLNHKLRSFEKNNASWLCHFELQTIKHDLLALTTAMHTLDFKQCEALPLSAARGQVTHIDTNPQLQKLKMTLCHEGYLTPINNGVHCMGATFKRHTMDSEFCLQEQSDNKQKLTKCIIDKQWTKPIEVNHNAANVGIRCTTRDHFPYIGGMPDYQKTKTLFQDTDKVDETTQVPFHENLFILTGLGSRGLNTAPLLAESLASQINHEPLPLTRSMLTSMQCHRQWLSYLKKGKALKF